MQSSLSELAAPNALEKRTPRVAEQARPMLARSFVCYAAFWSALVCAYLFLGAPRVWEAIRELHFGPARSYHTTDGYLRALLQISDGSERIQRVFAALPPRRPVAVLYPEGNEEAIFLNYVLGYFAWPREVQSIAVTRANAAARLRALDRHSLGVIFFCELPPPPREELQLQIGSRIVMVPLAPRESTP